jgi:hypothetical protein
MVTGTHYHTFPPETELGNMARTCEWGRDASAKAV